MTEAKDVRLVQTEPGKKVEYRGLRSYEKRTITIDREYDVFIGDTLIGHLVYRMFTRERRNRGARYVNARWQSPGWGYRDPGKWRTFEGYGRKDCIEHLVRDHERKKA